MSSPVVTQEVQKDTTSLIDQPQRHVATNLLDGDFGTPAPAGGESMLPEIGPRPPQPVPSAPTPAQPPEEEESATVDLDDPNTPPEAVADLEQRLFSRKVEDASNAFVRSELRYAPSPYNSSVMFQYMSQNNLPPTLESFREAFEATFEYQHSREQVNAERAAYGLAPLPPAGTLIEDEHLTQTPHQQQAEQQPRNDRGQFVQQAQAQPQRRIETGLSDTRGPAVSVDETAEMSRLLSIVKNSPSRDEAEAAMMRVFQLRRQQLGYPQH